MRIEIDPGGKVAFNAQQQRWSSEYNGDDAGVLETALFAGQLLQVITDDAGAFGLHYRRFKAGGFVSLAAAKQAAPEFARRVLSRVNEMVAD